MGPTTDSPKQPWKRYKEHRRRAAQFPLDILVWGPSSADNTLEYRKRCEIRNSLRAAGHHADFSEELIPTTAADLDPLDEELLQADSANLIMVLYEGRGVQTEVDTLLDKPRFAGKAVIFIHVDVYAKVQKSVAWGSWQKLRQHGASIIEYTTKQLERCLVVQQSCELAERARFAAYVDQVEEAAERW
jgi:hypothetical protein